MSTEVQSSQVDSGLTAASSGGAAAEKSHNKSEGAHLQREQAEQKGSERQLAADPEAAKSLAEILKKCKENDKENDQSSGSGCSADPAVEAVKRKVVEAPPPKVNPWTKRTTGRVPSNNINLGSQEKGEFLGLSSYSWKQICGSSRRRRRRSRSTLLQHFDSFTAL